MDSTGDIRHQTQYAHPSPYPKVQVLGPNLYYAELLMDDYAGVVSEFTAINQYLYHAFLYKTFDKELYELIEEISINEMYHMELLADAIILLGGCPIYRGSHSTGNQYWNGSFVHYGRDICDQIRANILAEQKAIANYRQHIQLIQDPYIKALLERIILDEEVHIQLFQKALAKYNCP